jgi:hypothetical protein
MASRFVVSAPTSPFVVLFRLFLGQFFVEDSVRSELQRRRTFVWILALLVMPGLFLLVMLYPEFQSAAIRARSGRGPASYVDDLLAWIAFLLTTYAMVSMGLVTVLSWDALTLDRRDALVLGALPVRSRTILEAKLAALGVLLAAGAFPLSLLNSLVFALETSDQLGWIGLIRQFASMLAATSGAAVWMFAMIVLGRGVVVLVGGPTLADACAPVLQFGFVLSALCLVILSPAVWPISFVTQNVTNAMPSAWFAMLYERFRGSPRADDVAFGFALGADRALVTTPLAMAAALLVSLAVFAWQMRTAVAPSATAGPLGHAWVARTLAGWLTGRNSGARATTDFILLTLARNRSLQRPLATSAALGVAVVIAGLSRNVQSLETLMVPRAAVLWIPLVMSYVLTRGLRASFLLPSEVGAAWSFRAHGTDDGITQWVAVRAALAGFVIPRTLIWTLLLAPLVGWAVTLWHALFVCAIAAILIQVTALTIRDVPFTQDRPEPASLNTRVAAHIGGLLLFAYWPVRLERWLLGDPGDLLMAIACIVIGIALLERVGRQKAQVVSPPEADGDPQFDTVTVLNIGSIAR